MKLKPVVATLFALGLVSGPALAGAHHRHGRAGFKSRAPYATSSFENRAHRLISQNNVSTHTKGVRIGRRVKLTAMANFDWQYTQHGPLGRTIGFGKESVNDLYVNNANVLIDVAINRCVDLHIGLGYFDDSVNNNVAGLGLFPDRDDSSIWSKDGFRGDGVDSLAFDEVYVTFSDFNDIPFYFRVGKMYTPFGHNPVAYPLTYSFYQLLSQTRATTAEIGGVTEVGGAAHDLYGSVFGIAGGSSRTIYRDGDKVRGATRDNNFGVKVAYDGEYRGFDYYTSASYLHDMRDVDYLVDIGREATHDFHRIEMRDAGAISLHGDVKFDMGAPSGTFFTAQINYVGALRRLAKGVKSSLDAWDLDGAYHFNMYGKNSDVAIGYQRTVDAFFIGMPKWRVIVTYMVNILPHTDLIFQYHYDKAYRNCHNDNCQEQAEAQALNGNGDDLQVERNSNTFGIRLAVRL